MPCVVRAARKRAPNFRNAVVHSQTMHPTQNADMPCVVRAARTCAPNLRHAVLHSQTMHPTQKERAVRAAHESAPNFVTP